MRLTNRAVPALALDTSESERIVFQSSPATFAWHHRRFAPCSTKSTALRQLPATCPACFANFA